MSKLRLRTRKRVRITVDLPPDVAIKLIALKVRAEKLGFSVSLSTDLVSSIRQHLRNLEQELTALEKSRGKGSDDANTDSR